MALGGGTFLTQNKVMPGTYINFVSKLVASATLSDRGYGALAIELDWGPDDTIFTVEQGDFQTDCKKIFGYGYTDETMKGLRDLFLYLKVGYFYRLNGGGVKASCTLSTAKYGGTRGNSIKHIVTANVDDPTKFDVSTYFDGDLVDKQAAVTDMKGLTDNDYVTWITTATLAATAGTALTGGTNGTSATGDDHSKFLGLLESYSFNVLGCLSTDETVKSLYVAYVKRMRDDVGKKFQVVLYNASVAPDTEGVINVATASNDDTYPASSAVYWVTGAEASCAVNRDLTNTAYNGEFAFTVDTKQSALIKHINAGELVFHKVNDDIRLLKDINSFTSFTTYKNRNFSLNQVIRVLDSWANDVALLFNTKYLGKVPSDADGRIALWDDECDLAKKMQSIEAIQNFDTKDITVVPGEEKEAVYSTCQLQPTCCMEKLYMLVTVA